MKVNNKDKDYIFKNVEISEVFFVKYFKEAPADAIKVYMFLQYFVNSGKEITILEISENTDLPRKTVQEALNYWEGKGIIVKRTNGYDCNSLQEMELYNRFSPKVGMTIDETISSLEKTINSQESAINPLLTIEENNAEKLKEKKREVLIRDINNRYFSGTMASHWYARILYWIEKYNFTEDLMLAIFEYCFSTGAKPAQYIETVSEIYYKEGIRTYSDFEKYLIKNEEVKKISKYIKRKLNLVNNLTEHQEKYVKKWVVEFGYKKDILDYMFEMLVNKSDLGFNYYDKILSTWNENQLKSKKEIQKFVKEQKEEKEKKSKLEKESKKNQAKDSYKKKEEEVREQRVFEDLEGLME